VNTGLDLTTLARVKTLIGEESNEQDDLLAQLIRSTSARIEGELGRKAKRQEYTEVYPLSESRHVLLLRAIPVDTDEDMVVKASASMDFSASTPLVANSGYVLDPQTSLLRFYGQFIAPRRPGSTQPSGPIYIQVQYTGGMAETTSAFVEAYPEIAEAVDLQVAYLHKRRNSPGGNMTVGSGSTSFESQYGLLSEVKALLAQHRRVDWH
jgi:hypothetical protein